MTSDTLSFGDRIIFKWGLSDITGTVHEVYGLPGRRHIVVMLTPELSGDIVDEPTTVSVLIDDVRRAAPAT